MDEATALQRSVEQARVARGLPRKPDAPRRLSASLLGAIMAGSANTPADFGVGVALGVFAFCCLLLGERRRI